jgi:DNA-binding response OmpR family regulator
MSRPAEILLVEDNPDDAELTIGALERHNLADRIIVARDGAEALELLHGELAHQFAFVMLDLKLPKILGHEVLRRVRADSRTRRLPVIILTSSGEPRDIVEGYDNGANSYVRKPVEFDEFTHAVVQLGLYWAVLNEIPDTDQAPAPATPS